MGLRAAVQALKKAEELKKKVNGCPDIFEDSEAWIYQQQLQCLYQQVLLLDLEYALDQKVEQELWNYGFKNKIGALQNQAKDKKNPKRSDCQTALTWFLEGASGFYLTLLQEICSVFDLDLPYRRKNSTFGSLRSCRPRSQVSEPTKSSCYYICQYCLVHLGDIARYRNQNRQAENFYRHAVHLSPSSGQPYNQLALLETSRGDRLSTVFHYVRSVAVRHPFPAAATNLERTLSRIGEQHIPTEGHSKISATEYISLFLRLHGLLQSCKDLKQIEQCVCTLTSALTPLVATEAFSSWKLVQMLAINLYSLHHIRHQLEPVDGKPKPETLSDDEQQACHLLIDLVAGSLNAFLLPVYMQKEGDSLLEYFALPAIKLTLEWIRLDPSVLQQTPFTSRNQIWPSLCHLLNGLQPAISTFNVGTYESVPLPEDCDLQGFLPLQGALAGYRFGAPESNLDIATNQRLRAWRLVELGRWLTNRKTDGYGLVLASPMPKVNGKLEDIHKHQENENSCEESKETPLFQVTGQHSPPSELLRELEEMTRNCDLRVPLVSPVPSDTPSWGTGSSTPDIGTLQKTLVSAEVTSERKPGILKPQGSLEKSRERDTVVTTTEKQGDVTKGVAWGAHVLSENVSVTQPIIIAPPAQRKGRQNVAIQALIRKANNTPSQAQSDCVSAPSNVQQTGKAVETKQVTFKTPSPCASSQGSEEGSLVPPPNRPNLPPRLQQAMAANRQNPKIVENMLPNVQFNANVPPPNFPPLVPPPSFYNNDTLLGADLSKKQMPVDVRIPPQMNVKNVQGHVNSMSNMNPFVSSLARFGMQNSGNDVYQQMPIGHKSSSFSPVVGNHMSPGVHVWGQNKSESANCPPGSDSKSVPVWGESDVFYRSFPAPPQNLREEEKVMRPNLSSVGANLQNPINNNIPYLSYLAQQQKQQQQQQGQYGRQTGTNSDAYVHPSQLGSGPPIGDWISTPNQQPPLNMAHLIGRLQQRGYSSSDTHAMFMPPVSHFGGFNQGSLLTAATQPPAVNRPDSHQSRNTQAADESRRGYQDKMDIGCRGNASGMDGSNVFVVGGNGSRGYSSVGSGSGGTSPAAASTYSLFSTPPWNTAGVASTVREDSPRQIGLSSGVGLSTGVGVAQPALQSLWSGPGPSPLERLLEQQKQQRESPPTKGGT